MTANLEHFAQRNRRYWYIDGISEIFTGVLFSLLGLLLYGRSLVSANSHLTAIFSTTQNILLTAGIGVGIVFVRWLKERSTYSRSGYVSYPQMTKKQIWTRAGFSIGIFLLTAITLIFCFLTFPTFRKLLVVAPLWLPLLISVVLGVNWIVLGLRNDIKRFFLIGGFALLTGIILGYMSLQTLSTIVIPPAAITSDPYGQMPSEIVPLIKIVFHQVILQGAICSGVIGFISLISGAVTRFIYLRQNPILSEEQP